MYLPKHFAETRPEHLQRVVREHPLGLLVHPGPEGADADHIPFLLDEAASAEAPKGRLLAHVARANPLWQRCPSGTPVLVVFRGPAAYISPSWYPSKADTHRQVPTWNYEAVHARGVLTVHDDARFLRGLLARLTRTHEAPLPAPWRMGDAPADFIDQLLQAIVGIEITVTAWEGKRKLSQNKAEADRLGGAAGAEAQGDSDLAAAMRAASRGD